MFTRFTSRGNQGMSYEKWDWSGNPFVLKIEPKLFVGYEEQVKALLKHIEDKHKIAVLTGPTGAGKSHTLKWLESFIDGDVVKLYLTKPPKEPDELVRIFTDHFGTSLLARLLGREPSLYTLAGWINGRLKGSPFLLLVDEAHETNRDVLEWMRVLVDQIDSVSMVMAGLPGLEQKVRDELPTLDQRITSRVTLTALTKEDTRALMQKRIEAVGGQGIKPFTDGALDMIYQRTGGFPREVLKMCDRLVGEASEKGWDVIEATNITDMRSIPESEIKSDEPVVTFSPKPPNEEQIANLPYRQKQLLEMLSKTDWLTPTALAEQIDMAAYTSKSHAIRSVNNILHRLMIDGFVQRESRGKAFMYALTPRMRTHFVQN